MHLTATSHPGATVLAANGRIDQASADAFLEALQPHLAACHAGSPPLLLDFSGVDYISSIGLRALMIAARQARASHGRLAIAHLQALVQEVFEIARFDLVIPCFADIESALKGVSA
jgi:anti-sigma B factor antagonist/stage II sporulation protein AA (anti-sigma F factor antagonist)